MTIGEKIKAQRQKRRMTQARVAEGCVSRNMLSLLEKGKVEPSIATLRHIASVLDIPIGYFLDEEATDPFFYVKNEKIGKIKRLYLSRKYKSCLHEIKKLDGTDDEVAYLSACCATALGGALLHEGNMTQAAAMLREAQGYTEQTIYDTTPLRMSIALHLPIADNVQSPLLELDIDGYTRMCEQACSTHFYHYLMQDTEHAYPSGRQQQHMRAKALLRERRYADAAAVLHDIENTLTTDNYDAFLFYGIYTDLESCYKELYDFEKAYRYAAKRMSLLESFRS